jgi:hypothetical protein
LAARAVVDGTSTAVSPRFQGVKCRIDKLGLSDEELWEILNSKPKNLTRYANYCSVIEHLRIVVRLLCKLHIVPETAYEKCFEGK